MQWNFRLFQRGIQVVSFNFHKPLLALVVAVALGMGGLFLMGTAEEVQAAAPCNEPDNIGGGVDVGKSPGPVGPPTSLGWDVGSGQCNGSFTVTNVPDFPGGSLQLGMRAEERRQGQVKRLGGNEYQVQLGPDLNPPPALNRAWWNFQHSIAYGGNIDDLDKLTFVITTQQGPNQPAAPSFDLLQFRPGIDARNNQPNATSGFSDLYQTSQNPTFGWFGDTFDFNAEGAWLMTLTAEKDGETASVSICVHTPDSQCFPDHFACHAVKEGSRLPKGLEVYLSDQFTTEDGVKVKRAKEICAPVNKNGEGILNPAFHLVCYDVKSPKRKKWLHFHRHGKKNRTDVTVTNQFTDEVGQHLRVDDKITRLCVPSMERVVR